MKEDKRTTETEKTTEVAGLNERLVICGFDKAWIGKCKTLVHKEGGKCEEHKYIKCCSCGAQATRKCDETGQFVCGAQLCDDCDHTIFEDGTNGGIGFNAQPPPDGIKVHCKKTEQKFKPWYARD